MIMGCREQTCAPRVKREYIQPLRIFLQTINAKGEFYGEEYEKADQPYMFRSRFHPPPHTGSQGILNNRVRVPLTMGYHVLLWPVADGDRVLSPRIIAPNTASCFIAG